MALLAASGALTLGNMTMYVLAFRQGQQAFQSALSGIGGLYEHNLYMSNLWEFLGIVGSAEARAARPHTNGVAQLGQGSATNGKPAHPRGIVFEDVGFRYPNKEGWALRHIDLVIPAGQSLALVGENGAGKTTLVKLLTRLYEPTEGRIVLDGRDLRDWDASKLRARFGVLFQDFNQYQLKVRENVGMGSIDHAGEGDRIERAVDRGGARSVVESLSGGLEAMLGGWFQGGTELSEASGRRSPSRAHTCARSATSWCSTSPRPRWTPRRSTPSSSGSGSSPRDARPSSSPTAFPTVRMASRIVVLENGSVKESGTHDEPRGSRPASTPACSRSRQRATAEPHTLDHMVSGDRHAVDAMGKWARAVPSKARERGARTERPHDASEFRAEDRRDRR